MTSINSHRFYGPGDPEKLKAQFDARANIEQALIKRNAEPKDWHYSGGEKITPDDSTTWQMTHKPVDDNVQITVYRPGKRNKDGDLMEMKPTVYTVDPRELDTPEEAEAYFRKLGLNG